MEQAINELLANPNIFWLALGVATWSIPWKGVALWKAAQNKSKWWFIVLLIVNTLAILEILYIFFFSKRAKEDPDLT